MASPSQELPPDHNHDYPPLIRKIQGLWAGHELQHAFRDEVAKLLSRANLNFPGAQPVSFAGKHIQELKREDYYVCEKTDGMRFLMYLTEEDGRGIHYLIDRKNNYYYIGGLHFPHHEDKAFARFHTNTILDGELVEDRYPNKPPVMKFLVFDLLCIDGVKMMHRPLDKRLAYFKSQILEPYKAFYRQDSSLGRPFVVEDKTIEFSYGLEKMFKEIIPKVKQLHGNDGLIFTCKNTAYKHGTDEHILKWKPPEENTIDLLLHIIWKHFKPDPDDTDQSLQPDFLTYPDRFELYVHTNTDRSSGVGEYTFFDDLHVTPEDWTQMKSLGIRLQDVVVECYQEAVPTANGHAAAPAPDGAPDGPAATRWRFLRAREDKLDSNHVSVVESVMQSIADRVTEDDLLGAAPAIRTAWKAREEEARRLRRHEDDGRRTGSVAAR